MLPRRYHAFRINKLLDLPLNTFDDVISRGIAEGRIRLVGERMEWVVTPIDRESVCRIEHVNNISENFARIARRHANWQRPSIEWLTTEQRNFVTIVRNDFIRDHLLSVTEGIPFSRSDYLHLYTRRV